MQGTWQSPQWSLAAMLRYSRDDQSYHPWLAEGQPRRQRVAPCSVRKSIIRWAAALLRGAPVLTASTAMWEFFTTRRDEYLLGLAYAW